MDIKDIKSIIDLMKLNSLSEFELEKEGLKIKLKRSINGTEDETSVEKMPASRPQKSHTPVAETGSAAPSKDPVLVDIKAPMVGTFYLSPSPESAPYVERGSQVNPDTVVCIVEAMKVMNEIKAEVRGTVVEVAATNGKPVEFGQTLFRIKPN